MMIFGGNKRAHEFFTQHGRADLGKLGIEAKYTSTAANAYRQILAKDVAKSMAEASGGVSCSEQTPKESFSTNNNGIKTSFAPQFECNNDLHSAPPMQSSFSAGIGMDSAFSKKSTPSLSSKLRVSCVCFFYYWKTEVATT